MRKGFPWKYAAGAALLLGVIAVVAVVFSLLSRTDRQMLSLADNREERRGWSYELLVDGQARAYAPEFEPDGFAPALPEGTSAVRIRRAMTEEIPSAELTWMCDSEAVELSLDGRTLHSDLPGAARGADGFLRPGAEDWAGIYSTPGVTRRMCVSLSKDYVGGELCVTTYFPEGTDAPAPIYPSIRNEDFPVADVIVYSVKSNATMTVYAMLALVIAALFLLDIPNDGADAKTLLLCLYFLLLFLNDALFSFSGYYSALGGRIDPDLLNLLYVMPLYLYLALRLKRRWKYPLCGALVIWALYELVRRYLDIRNGLGGTAQTVGPEALAVFLSVSVASCVEAFEQNRRSKERRRRLVFYGLISAAILLIYLINKSRAWGSLRDYLTYGVGVALSMGNCEPLVSLVSDITSAMALIVVVSEFLRRTLRNRQEISVLQERGTQTMESYERLLAAEEATNALRHELRHHMNALAGILDSGDAKRAYRYVRAVTGEFEQLPVGRYSQNMLVNVIAGNYLDRARAQGIRVEHRLAVPPEMNIADEDLSVFLSNLLQNALEACERMDEAADRYIQLEMRLRGCFLFIKCVNSAPEEDEEARSERRPGHGFGLPALRKIARKYNSVLLVERSPGEFTAMSDFCLKNSGA